MHNLIECGACRYKAGQGYDFNKNDFEYFGDKEFIRIKQTFMIESDVYFASNEEVDLYACPECGTVRMERK